MEINPLLQFIQRLFGNKKNKASFIVPQSEKMTQPQPDCTQTPAKQIRKKRRQNSEPTELSQSTQELLSDLQNKIGYHFSNPQLLIEALTHSSVALDRANNPFDNERLEFLGDSVLQLVITNHLFQLFPHFEEGPLTKIRTRLVSRTALKAYASHLDLGKYLIMGRGEEISGGRDRSSILGDSFEALIGAIYLDSSLETTRTFILKEAEEQLRSIMIEPEEINPKGHLQELLQSKGSTSPLYEHIAERGEAHLKQFRCRVLWEGHELGTGEGRSKKEAEVAAATQALKALAS